MPKKPHRSYPKSPAALNVNNARIVSLHERSFISYIEAAKIIYQDLIERKIQF
jgi:hypothetical protein